MEVFLRALLPRLLPIDRTFEVYSFHGKADLLGKLQARLRAYAKWLPQDWRIVVVVDQDGEDCKKLKKRLEGIAANAGLLTRSVRGKKPWQMANRIAIEELEAWYFGDWNAVCSAFPRVSSNIPNHAGYRDHDKIRGGTWETFRTHLAAAWLLQRGSTKSRYSTRAGREARP